MEIQKENMLSALSIQAQLGHFPILNHSGPRGVSVQHRTLRQSARETLPGLRRSSRARSSDASGGGDSQMLLS